MIGRCFYYDTPPNGEHLFVVLAPSLEKNGYFIRANISTKRPNSDTTCEIPAGSHPNLTSEVSVVVYGHARELPTALIERLSGHQKVPDLGAILLLKIQTAPLKDDSRLPNKFKKAIQKHLGMAT